MKRADLRGIHRQLFISPTSSSFINGKSMRQLDQPATVQQSQSITFCLLRCSSPHVFVPVLLLLSSLCGLNFSVFYLFHSCTFPFSFSFYDEISGRKFIPFIPAAVFILISKETSFSFSSSRVLCSFIFK